MYAVAMRTMKLERLVINLSLRFRWIGKSFVVNPRDDLDDGSLSPAFVPRGSGVDLSRLLIY